MTLEQKYAALAPVLSLAGIFIHPIATIVIPMGLFFLFYWRRLGFAGRVAIRAADLAFSIILYQLIVSVVMIGLTHYRPMQEVTLQNTITIITIVLLIYLAVSLIIAAVYAARGRVFGYLGSLRVAERVLDNFTGRRDST